MLAPRVIDACEEMSEDAWADCAAAFSYVFSAAVESGDVDDQEVTTRRLYLTAALLQRVPPRSEIEILDADRAIDLFFAKVPVSDEFARRVSPEWRRLDIDTIRKLRRSKNLVKPALLISDSVGRSDIERRLATWREVLPFLP
jgi:hypothetical protein